MKDFNEKLSRPGITTLSGAPGGLDALILGRMAEEENRDVVFIARDDAAMARMDTALEFFYPELDRREFPAWDCLPYDRVSPKSDIAGIRVDTLSSLLAAKPIGRVVLTSVSAVLQKVPPRSVLQNASLAVEVGQKLAPDELKGFLVKNGYVRTDMVVEPGEFAVRGGILDVFAPGMREPLRLDFFGDEIDGIRSFEPSGQRTTGKVRSALFKPVSEVVLDEQSVSRFRTAYRELFGAPKSDDLIYEGVSGGRRPIGFEHWIALFHERMETLFDYVPEAAIFLDHQTGEAFDARWGVIADYYSARVAHLKAAPGDASPPYNPVPPERLYLDQGNWEALLVDRQVCVFSPFSEPDGAKSADMGGRLGKDFGDVRARHGENVFDALRSHMESEAKGGRRVLIAAFSKGSRDRLKGVLQEHHLKGLASVDSWAEAKALDPALAAITVLGLERGFSTAGLTVLSEQDILGDRLIRPSKAKISPENFIAEASSLSDGDLIVHAEHGIGRYDGLQAISVNGAPHDCLRLIYGGGDKLFLPVENIEVVSRYGSDQGGVQLDRLGGAAWQARKAKMKQRIRDMAAELIKIAAVRTLKQGTIAIPPAGLYDEFCARFPFTETDDQLRAITAVMDDLGRGRPADRLVCGDVGFGKTEIALRAAFTMAMSGRQVAVVTPTTLLCRQHFQTFMQRFEDYPVRIEQLSRLVGPKRIKEAKAGLSDGTVDIVIGTHALLAKDIRFRDLGLLVIDEEQHFGVAHKEKLKKLKADVHVLTLTATPIPRTLQLALTGVREMSLIATPPVDRLAIRTFVLPYDPVVIREALMRERFRGGQTFYVCPRIEDLEGVEEALKDLVPEIKTVTVHGRMAAKAMEEAVSAFYDGAYDLLLSTNIIESGIDMPSVNTIVIHRADMFGLSQLYQLRGRVGRSKVRAYAYLTIPPRRKPTKAAEKRLEVMQTLDTLGAGFTLASYDLDIRGAGNLLGGEQSGHIREVGIELYQKMLEEAVAEAKGLDDGEAGDGEWSPQIGLGMAVLIPESYVSDLNLRMDLYRRIARLGDKAAIESFAAEMIDRFGSLPEATENLLQTVALKVLCKAAGVAKVDAGPKGAVVSFHNEDFANPAGLVAFITSQVGTAKLRPDHKLVYKRSWDGMESRLAGVKGLLSDLAEIASA